MWTKYDWFSLNYLRTIRPTLKTRKCSSQNMLHRSHDMSEELLLFIKKWFNNTAWGTSYGTTNLPSNQPIVGTKIWSYISLKKGCVHLRNQQTWMSNCQTKWETLWICQFLFFINISTVQPIDTRISALKCEWKMPWNWQQCEREVWTLSLHVSNFPTLQA